MKGLLGIVMCAGQITSANHTSTFNDTMGMLECRPRHNTTLPVGIAQPDTLVSPGYPAALKQYGMQVPCIGPMDGKTTLGGGGVNASATTWTVAATATFGASGYLQVDQEVCAFTKTDGTTLTVTRGAESGRFANSTPAAHSNGATIQEISIYSGPQAAYLAASDLTVAILIGDVMSGAGVITVTSTAAHLSAGNLKIDNELFAYTGKTATTFTGVTRGSFSTAAAGHSIGALAGQWVNGASVSTMLSASKHPIGSGASFIQSLYWMTVIGGSALTAAAATATLSFYTQPTPVNTDNTVTSQTSSSAINIGNAAHLIGSVHRSDFAKASSDLTSTGQVTLDYGISPSNGVGVGGPCGVMFQLLSEANRPVGAIQSCGINQGGRTLNHLLKNCRQYDTVNSVCEYDIGYVTRFRNIYVDATLGIGASAIGGNGSAGYVNVVCFGHNEAAGSTAETALVDPTESWTIARQTTINGGTAVTNNSTSAITVVSTAGSPSAGHILIDGERIGYTSITATTYGGTITRGMYGTVPAAHANGTAVYQGNLIQNPQGFATDMLFYYNLKKSLWLSAGGSVDNFRFVWVRPIPVSATSTVVADDTATSTNANKEYKLTRFAQAVSTNLGTRAGFIIGDTIKVATGGETTTYDYGISSADQTHNSNSAYEMFWHRLFAYEAYFNAGKAAAPVFRVPSPSMSAGPVTIGKGRNAGGMQTVRRNV
jgi:hypothetical protein